MFYNQGGTGNSRLIITYHIEYPGLVTIIINLLGSICSSISRFYSANKSLVVNLIVLIVSLSRSGEC